MAPRSRAAATALVLLVVLAAPGGAAAAARPHVSVTARPGGAVVRVDLASPLPLVDARPELRLDGRVLGQPRVLRGRTLVLDVPGLAPGSAGRIEAWLGGRRLGDAARQARRPGRTAPIVPATPVGTPVAVDPGARGPYATTRARYRLPSVRIGDLPANVEVVGEVTLPTGAPGARPLVLILHGRHGTCFRGDASTGDWPCEPGFQPIASETGYRAIADLLASQGNVVVSIAANGINGQDDRDADGGATARSTLVAHHLDLWTRWAASGGAPFGDVQGRVDTARTILIGHSRGGEGVARRATLGPGGAAWRIRGLLLIAPTNFGLQPALGVPTAVLLPTCDGDVSDLQGQSYVDAGRDLAPADAALRSSVLVVGGSHNAFNTEWMPATATAPAFDDSACPGEPERIGARTERAVGATYAAALVRVALDGDLDAASLLDGSAVHAPSAGASTVHSTALGGARALAFRAGSGSASSASGVTARSCNTRGSNPVACLLVPSPHFLTMAADEPPLQRGLRLGWSSAGGKVDIATPSTPLPPGATHLELRAIVGPASPAVRLAASVIDGTGAELPLGPAAGAARLPGIGDGWTSWAQTFRFALPAVPAGFAITGIRLRPLTGRGAIVALDASLRGAGLPAIAPIALPRVDVGTVVVREGGPTTRRVLVPLTVAGAVGAGAAVRVVTISPTLPQTARTVAITPGATTVEVPVAVRGNRRYDLISSGTSVLVFPQAGAIVGASAGGVLLREDDPRPRVIVTPRRLDVREGRAATIRIRLTRRISSAALELRASPPPRGRRPLRVADVDLEGSGWGSASTSGSLTLARAGAAAFAFFDPGTSTAVIRLQIREDGVAEPPEQVVLRLRAASLDERRILPRPIDVLLTVRDG